MKFEKKLIFFELRRHYILGVINLITGLGLLNFFQYFIFQNINISLRTDLSITMSYIVGVTISYFLTSKFVFQINFLDGTFFMYIKFMISNLLNYVVSILVWFVIEIYITNYSQSFFNIVNFGIAFMVFPLKFLIYKFLIFNKK
ncbi:GtrA family protein [Acidimicrobiia bacterium]|nr:GtrA family protein [Acidimicrobiia bacterium]